MVASKTAKSLQHLKDFTDTINIRLKSNTSGTRGQSPRTLSDLKLFPEAGEKLLPSVAARMYMLCPILDASPF